MYVQGEVIQAWLITHLAEQVGIEPQDIDVHQPFTEYGLDSMVGVSLAGDLEDWLGLDLSPTLLWDYPTVETLTRYLAEEIKNGLQREKSTECCNREASEDVRVDRESAVQHLAKVDELSDADVDTLLGSLLATEEAYRMCAPAASPTALCLQRKPKPISHLLPSKAPQPLLVSRGAMALPMPSAAWA
jgi:acyl carrier protein